MNRLGIIVPYRNRSLQLMLFKQEIQKYLDNTKIDYRIIIVEQNNDKLFNRGTLLNIGFKYAKKLKCDYVVFHDVDMIPIDVDYSYSDIPIHLAEKTFDEYFGGVTLFPIKAFEKINGYSNKYWGWGFEDDDLLLRCKRKDIKLNRLKLYNSPIAKTSLKFNGTNSYVKVKNKIDFTKDLTISVSFFPDDIVYNHKKDSDTFSVFSIPGYDASISYNSFKRYNFLLFNKNKEILYLTSEMKTNYKTTITITIDSKNKKINFYQDASLVDTIEYDNLYNYNKEPYFYLGMGSPHRPGDENYFKGYIDSFMVFNKVMNEDDIKNIIEMDYKEIKDSVVHFNTNEIERNKLKDLSGNKNDGQIINCEIVNKKISPYKIVKIPYRRNSKFISLYHENNGFVNNKWKHQETRWNQLRFSNEVSTNPMLSQKDGLCDLYFVENSKIKENNTLQINVGI